jgi:hypothetical protein
VACNVLGFSSVAGCGRRTPRAGPCGSGVLQCHCVGARHRRGLLAARVDSALPPDARQMDARPLRPAWSRRLPSNKLTGWSCADALPHTFLRYRVLLVWTPALHRWVRARRNTRSSPHPPDGTSARRWWHPRTRSKLEPLTPAGSSRWFARDPAAGSAYTRERVRAGCSGVFIGGLCWSRGGQYGRSPWVCPENSVAGE